MCFEYFHVFYLFFSNLNNNEYDEKRLPLLTTLHLHNSLHSTTGLTLQYCFYLNSNGCADDSAYQFNCVYFYFHFHIPCCEVFRCFVTNTITISLRGTLEWRLLFTFIAFVFVFISKNINKFEFYCLIHIWWIEFEYGICV